MTQFEAGQRWSYRTRPGEEQSEVIVLKVEPHAELGDIVHVRIEGLRMRSPRGPGGFNNVIGHMPYSSAALAASVSELKPSGVTIPDFAEGYGLWKEAFDKGEGGIWTLPLAECITAMEGVIAGSRKRS